MHFPPPEHPHPRRVPSLAPGSAPSDAARRPHPTSHRWGLRLGIAGGILALIGGGLFAANRVYLPNGVLPGLTIDGMALTDSARIDDAALHAFVDERVKHALERKVELRLQGRDKPLLEATLGELGLSVDAERTMDVARRAGKDTDMLGRIEAARDARAGKVDVPLYMHIDAAAALARILPLKEGADISPVSARLDLDKHETVAEKDGQYIDTDEAIAMLSAIVKTPSPSVATIVLPMKSFAPRVSSAFLKSLDISTVVAEYETGFSRGGDQQKRGKNIDNAAQKLDGVVVSPGELLSFNEVIGERSESNGFQKSWEIFKGEMVEGVGGGTCQVASTFHAATFFAGFDVLERLPHSRPSAYIPMGLDSTVVYPAVDLKVRNPHPFPVVVHAKTVGNRLRVELLGKMRPVHVGFGREVVSTLPYKRKIEEDSALTGKKVVVKQHGIKGYKIKRTRLFTYPNGTRKKEELTDTYPPTTEIYKVPVGFDVALLPPLPEGDQDEDPDLGANPSPAPASARTPSPQGTDATATATATSTAAQPASGDVEFVDAPGAHAPTAAQREPVKTLWLKR